MPLINKKNCLDIYHIRFFTHLQKIDCNNIAWRILIVIVNPIKIKIIAL